MTDKDVWLKAYLAKALTHESRTASGMFADSVLKEYRERFPEPAKPAKPKPELKPPNTTLNYPLFEHMAKEHGLTLLESELDEIMRKVDQCRRETQSDSKFDQPPIHFEVSDGVIACIPVATIQEVWCSMSSKDWACVTCPECKEAMRPPVPTKTVCGKASETGPCVLLKGHDGRCDFDQPVEPGVPGVLPSKPSTFPVIHMEHDDTETLCGTSGISSKDRTEVTCLHCIGLFDIPF